MFGRVLTADGISDLLLADGISFALLSDGDLHGQLRKANGIDSVLLANGVDHVLLVQRPSVAGTQQSGGSGSSLEFPFKTRPLPPIDKLIEEFALPPTKPSRSTARVLAQAAADYQMALLLLLND